jgi:hypothetical protein
MVSLRLIHEMIELMPDDFSNSVTMTRLPGLSSTMSIFNTGPLRMILYDFGNSVWLNLLILLVKPDNTIYIVPLAVI